MTHHSFQRPLQRGGFTLLEVVIVMAIVALLLTAMYNIAQGTLVLADNIQRAERRESRQQAFSAFCEHLFADVPATSALNLRTTQDGGQYLAKLELENVRSPFDSTPGCLVTLFTEPLAGGGLRLLLSCQKKTDTVPVITVVLFDSLAQCEWRAWDQATRQWTTVWNEPPGEGIQRVHPALMELSMIQPAGGDSRQVFWITPNEAVTPLTPLTPPAP